jgi:hypothetical protein
MTKHSDDYYYCTSCTPLVRGSAKLTVPQLKKAVETARSISPAERALLLELPEQQNLDHLCEVLNSLSG